MPIVNYVREHMAFIEYASDNGLSGTERTLWYALIHIFNQRANGGIWPDGFIRINNDRLMSYMPCGFDAMAKARNSLVQRGLLTYVRGHKNTEVPMYQMHYLTVPRSDTIEDQNEYSADAGVNYSFCPEKTDNMDSQHVDKPVDNIVDNPLNNSVYPTGYPEKTDRTYNITPKLNQTKLCVEEEDEEEEEYPRAREYSDRASKDSDMKLMISDDGIIALAKAADREIRASFGRQGTPEECSRIALLASNLGLSDKIVRLVIKQAALANARHLFAYATKMMQELSYEDIRTEEEYAQYRFLIDLRDGRIDGAHHDVADDLESMRRERRHRHELDDGGGLSHE